MKKLNMEVKFEIVVEIAKLFDIDGSEMEHETLVTKVNESIDNLLAEKPAKAGKWYENTELTYKEGDVVDVVSGWAKGRLVQIERPSAKKNAFKGFLINPKTGEPQGTLVTVDEVDIQIYVPNGKTEEKVEAEAV